MGESQKGPDAPSLGPPALLTQKQRSHWPADHMSYDVTSMQPQQRVLPQLFRTSENAEASVQSSRSKWGREALKRQTEFPASSAGGSLALIKVDLEKQRNVTFLAPYSCSLKFIPATWDINK